MNFVPILIANLILLVITILLAIADKLLVTYGECKITISSDDEQKELLVEGGNNLLSYLIDNNVVPCRVSAGFFGITEEEMLKAD